PRPGRDSRCAGPDEAGSSRHKRRRWPHPPPSPSAARRQSRSSRAGDRRRGSSPPARAGSSCRRSSVFLPERGWSRNQTLPESADDRRATQLHHVRGRHHALSVNLRRGRFLLLIVGDGIREGVEAIADYLQRHAGLHFAMGLVEMPIFTLPDGGLLVTPRVLARTVSVVRTVISAPDGHHVVDQYHATGESSDELDADREAL